MNCYSKYGSGLAILGDSHAIDLYGVVTSSNSYPFIIGVTKGGCRPHTPRPECQYDDFLTLVKSNTDIFYGVIYEQAGFYLLRTDKKRGDRDMFSSIPLSGSVNGIYPDEDHIKGTYNYLKRLSAYVYVVWFGPRIEPHITDKMILKMSCNFKFKTRRNEEELFDNLDSYINRLTKGSARMHFVSQNEVLKYKFPDDFMTCNNLYWFDGDHLSSAGEIRFGKRFDFNKLFH